MSTALIAFAICFVITGYGIPIYGTALVFEPSEHPLIRLFIGSLVVFWCVMLSISVNGLVELAAKP